MTGTDESSYTTRAEPPLFHPQDRVICRTLQEPCSSPWPAAVLPRNTRLAQAAFLLFTYCPSFYIILFDPSTLTFFFFPHHSCFDHLFILSGKVPPKDSYYFSSTLTFPSLRFVTSHAVALPILHVPLQSSILLLDYTRKVLVSQSVPTNLPSSTYIHHAVCRRPPGARCAGARAPGRRRIRHDGL